MRALPYSALLLAVVAAAMQPLCAQDRAVVLVANQGSESATLINLADGTSVDIRVGAGPHEAAILPGAELGVVTVYGVRGAPGNQLAVIDLDTRTVERTIDLGTYTRPHGVVPVPGQPHLVAVTSESTKHLIVVNVLTGAVERAIGTRAAGSHMAALPTRGAAAGTRAYTANIPEGSLSEFDLSNGTLLRVMPVSSMTEGVAVTPDGAQVWMGSNDKGTVSVVQTGSVGGISIISGFQFPYRIGISADGRTAVIVDPPADAVHVVDVATQRITGRIDGLASPRGVAIAADGRTAMVTSAGSSSVVQVDLVDFTELRRFPVGTAPDGVAYVRP